MFEILILTAQIVQSGGFVLDMGTGQIIAAPTGEAQSEAFPPPQELLQNTGFETGALPPWHQMSSTWVITTIFPHSGTYCAADVGNYWIRQNFAQPVPTESIISITFWSRQPDNQIQAFDLMYSDSTYYEWIVWPTVNWQQFNVTSYLAMGKMMVGFRLWGYVGGGPAPDSTYIDDISIIAGVPLYEEVEESKPHPGATLSAWPSAFSQACRVDIHAPTEGKLCLYNSSGSLVKELWHGQGKGTVWLGHELRPGAYVLLLEYGGTSVSRTVIKQ